MSVSRSPSTSSGRALKAHILLVLVTLVWGATFVVIKDALQDVSALLFNAVRMVLASAALAVIFGARLRGLGRSAGAGMLVGVFLYAGYEFQTSGLRFTTPSKSAFITGVSVVLVPVFMTALFRRRAGLWTWFGVALTFTGLYFMTIPAGQAFESVNLGDLLTFVCAVAFAFQIISVGRATTKEHGNRRYEHIAFLQTATAAVLMTLSFPLLEHPHVVWSARVVVAILITGLLGTAAAFSIQTWAQQFLPATNTALIFALEPVFAWLTAWLFMHEGMSLRSILGAGMILGGILVSELIGTRTEP